MSKFLCSLFARPSFLEGAARVIDFGDTLTEFNTSLSPQQADYLALQSDWCAVGDDLREAVRQFSDTQGDQPKKPQREQAGPVR